MSKLKVLLIMALNDKDELTEEMGIGFIASVTKESGREVLLINNRESDINYQQIIDFKPDIVGMTMYSTHIEAMRRVWIKLRLFLGNIPLVIGGAFPSMQYNEIMQYEPMINYIVRGEGEYTWLELLECIENNGDLSKVKGLTYRGKDKIENNPDRPYIKDLDLIPYPMRVFIDDTTYISTSRGCVMNCSFCNSRKFWSKWRGKSPLKVVDEIEELNKKGIYVFNFTDNSFEDPDGKCTRGLEIAKEIIRRGLKIVWKANFRAEFWRVATPEIMNILKASGLIAVNIGIETANEQDRILYNKYASLEDNKKIIELFESNDIYVTTNIIIINPYSTIEGLRTNIKWLEDMDKVCYRNISCAYMIFEGTNLLNKLKADGLLKQSYYHDVYAYNMIDNRLWQVIEYVCGVWHEWIQQHNYYKGTYLVSCKMQAQMYNSYGDIKRYDIVKEYENKVNELCKIIGHYIAEFYRGLLYIAESGWDKEEAFKMEVDLVENNNIAGYLEQLHSLQKELAERLSL